MTPTPFKSAWPGANSIVGRKRVFSLKAAEAVRESRAGRTEAVETSKQKIRPQNGLSSVSCPSAESQARRQFQSNMTVRCHCALILHLPDLFGSSNS